MDLKKTLQNNIHKPWFIALILTAMFLIFNGYRYGWDDQHLEIPLLKHLIDPTLYAGDYYIESLRKNFSSYFYPILSRLITIDQIPATYFFLYILSRYFLIYWIYKMWLYLTNDRFKAISCSLVFMLMARVSEFLYQTFSHQEFALAIIFAGIYFFFKERFVLAAIILGIAANFHALYSLFPMFFMSVYLCLFIKKHGVKTLLQSSTAFLLASLPFIVWIFKNRLGGNAFSAVDIQGDWLPLFAVACPQNFFFSQFPLITFEKLTSEWRIFYYFTQSYIFLLSLLILNISFNQSFRKNGKVLVFTFSAFALLLICFVFTQIYPSRLILDLNLSRNTQFLLFLLMGYTTILAIETIERKKLLLAFIFGILFTCIKYGNVIATLSIVLMFIVFLFEPINKIGKKSLRVGLQGLLTLCMLPIGFKMLQTFIAEDFRFLIRLNIIIIFSLLSIAYIVNRVLKDKTLSVWYRRVFVIIPLCIFFLQYCEYHYERRQIENSEHGFWRVQKNWEDMQRYVRAHTPKNALLLVPYNMEMGGFRIQSERKIICSYRDCGIIGFDYSAAVEWQRRVKDIEAFRIRPHKNPKQAIQNAIALYNVDYIVFMRFYAPPTSNVLLKKIYTNRDFVLFEVDKSSISNTVPH